MNLRYCFMAGTAAALVASATTANAQDIRVVVDGERVHFRGQPPIEVDDRVLVPLRGVFEDLGAQVNWNPQEQTVTARRGDTRVKLTIGERTASVNGEPVRLDVPAQIIDDSTMVPLRFVGEALGDRVHWDEESQTVSIIGAEFSTDRHDEGDYNAPHGWRRSEGEVGPPIRRRPVGGDYDSNSGPDRPRIVDDNVPDNEPPVVYGADTVLPVTVDGSFDWSNCYPGERITTVVPSYPGLPPNCEVSGVVVEVGRHFRDRSPLVDLRFDSIRTPGGRQYRIDGRGVPFNSTTVRRGENGMFRGEGPRHERTFVRADNSRGFGIRLSQPVRVQRETGRSSGRGGSGRFNR